MHKHLVQLKRNNGKSSQYTGKDDENKNDKLLASVKCEASKNRPYNIKFFTSRKNSSQKKPTRQFAGKMVEGRQPRFSNGFESDKQ